mmetsp:Transcript_16058/g.28866  ORF Transcript_16058/g.28866 Transcript_16058/m.28866 type:complete len:151 (+) Transcript_16058:3-455(+)
MEQPTLSPPTQFPCARTEIVRRPVSAGGFYDNAPEKVFRGLLTPDGSLQLSVDFERDGIGGQEPPTPNEARGPLHIDLMVGEVHVLKSIVQYSLPRLTGWSDMMDHSMEEAIRKSTGPTNHSSPHNYQTNTTSVRGNFYSQGNDEGNVPF